MASILSRGRSVKDRNCWHTEIRGVQRFKMADMTKSQYIPINDDKIVLDTFQKSQRSVLIWWVGSHCWVTIPVNLSCSLCNPFHNDVIKWKPFPRYWPFVWGIHRSRWIPLTKASDAELWCFLLSTPWIRGWVNYHETTSHSLWHNCNERSSYHDWT